MSLIAKIKKSEKKSIKQLLEIVKKDTRTTTGHNLRTIMMLTGMNRIEDLDGAKIDFEYHQVEQKEKWRIGMAKELINIKFGELEAEGFEMEETSLAGSATLEDTS